MLTWFLPQSTHTFVTSAGIKTHIKLSTHIQRMNKIDQILLETQDLDVRQVWFTRPEVKRAVKLALNAQKTDDGLNDYE